MSEDMISDDQRSAFASEVIQTAERSLAG